MYIKYMLRYIHIQQAYTYTYMAIAQYVCTHTYTCYTYICIYV